MTITEQRAKAAARSDGIARLKELCPEGTRIYSVTKHISQSGMLHVIDLFVIHDNVPIRITGMIANTFDGYNYNRTHEGLNMRGTGYSHGRAAVDHLASALYGDMNALKHSAL